MKIELYSEQDIEEQRAFWNAHARPCDTFERRSGYADTFLTFSGIRAGESVFDMGCGTGTLCLPLADDGHPVCCADFSDAVLHELQTVKEREGLSLITLERLSWQEDWSKRTLPVCDLAFASRCLFGIDPDDAIKKLSAHARRRVCVTVPLNEGMFKAPSAPYGIGEDENVRAYGETFIASVRNAGYEPETRPMGSTGSGESNWLFIAWDIR